MRRGLVIVGMLVGIGVGCGLRVRGTRADDSLPDDDASVPVPDGAPFDAPPDGDASSDASLDAPDDGPDAGCPPLGATAASGARSAVVLASRPAPAPAKAVDGDVSDYRPCVAVRVDTTTAARVFGMPAASAALRMEWEPSALWIAADVTDGKLEGNDATLPFVNDSLEIYVSSNPLRNGDYGPTDHHYIVDHNGLAVDYSNHASPAPMPATNVHVSTTTTGYRIEMKIDAVTAFGFPLFGGQELYFDVLLSDGKNQVSYLIWAAHPHAACPFCSSCSCNSSPASDTLMFSPITLQQ